MNPISKISRWYFSQKALPYWCILALDCLFVITPLLMAYILNNGLVYSADHVWQLCGTCVAYLICYVIGFRLLRTYSGVLRYSSFIDLGRVGWSVLIGAGLSIIFKYSIGNHWPFLPFDLNTILFGALVSMLLMWWVRVVVKHLYDTLYRRSDAQRVFILGIKDGGISIAKSIRNQDPAKYVVAGFVTVDTTMVGKMLMGEDIYLFDENLAKTMVNYDVRFLFVSPLRSDSLRDNSEIVNTLIEAGISIFLVPEEMEWDGKSDLHVQTMREISIEDLLPREQIQVDLGSIGAQLTGKRILITGAAGSIGSEIVRQVSTFNPEKLILVDQAETPLHDIRLMQHKDFPKIDSHTIVGDITNYGRMKDLFVQHRPQLVFHAAAYKHVPMMEDNPYEAIRNNVEGTRIMADLAVSYGVEKFVMISTDKAVNPTNVMGCSKRICEIYVQSLDKAIKERKIKAKTRFVTTRFGNVLGSNGSVIPLFKEQIKNGGPLTVTHPDIIRFFMLIPEACKLVLEAGTMGHGGEIFVFDMGKPVKIVDLARRMIQLSGSNVEIVFTGLRDGEKLYEEVLNEEETTLPTFHPKIKIARVREYDYDEINAEIGDMVNNCQVEDAMHIVARMKALVPEFKSPNSIYQVLDESIGI